MTNNPSAGKSPKDDLDAVRTIVAALQGFDREDQERILRWATEKMGLPAVPTHSPKDTSPEHGSEPAIPERRPPVDIKSFVKAKNPKTDQQLAATIGYYYRFEAPEHLKKESITGNDVTEACRLVDWRRPKVPDQTLRNAFQAGLFDRSDEAGSFRINAVGENLVAMTLPEGQETPAANKKKKAGKRRKKKAPKR